MISYRQADLLDMFSKENEIVGIAYLNYKPMGTAGVRFVTEFNLEFKTQDPDIRKKVMDLFEDVYEGLPTVIRDSYQQSPSGYSHMYGGTDHVLTMVKEPENPDAPYPEFIMHNINRRFELKGIDNDVINPPRAIGSSGISDQFFICGKWPIKIKDLPQ